MRFPSYLELDDKIKINEVIPMADKQKKTNPDEEFLQDLYKNACMGTDSVTTVLGKTKDEKPFVQKTVVNDLPKVGRNQPCPCGSGKKYKNCCGK